MAFSLPEYWEWAFWLAHSGAKHHMYYLQAPKSLGNAELRRRSVQEGDGHWRKFYTGARFLVSGESANVQSVGVATSPLRKYRDFARLRAQENPFDHLLYVALDAYVHGGGASDVHRSFRDYEHALAAIGGVDIQIFGIRTDGHIGFSEPTSFRVSRIRVETPSEGTRKDNARFFPKGDMVPRHCITQGLGTITAVKDKCSGGVGKTKASCSRFSNGGPVTNICAKSLRHTPPSATTLLDEDAASHRISSSGLSCPMPSLAPIHLPGTTWQHGPAVRSRAQMAAGTCSTRASAAPKMG